MDPRPPHSNEKVKFMYDQQIQGFVESYMTHHQRTLLPLSEHLLLREHFEEKDG